MSDFHKCCQIDEGADTVVAGSIAAKQKAFKEQPGTLALGIVEGGIMRITGRISVFPCNWQRIMHRKGELVALGLNLGSDFSSKALFLTQLPLLQFLLSKVTRHCQITTIWWGEGETSHGVNLRTNAIRDLIKMF